MAEQSDMADITLIAWNELPDHLKEKILSRLPFKSLFRFRSVCKGWKSFLTSMPFLQNPWLMICSPMSPMLCFVYSFDLQAWETLSLSFLEEKFRIFYKGLAFQLMHFGAFSALELLLVDMRVYSSGSSYPGFFVCNPLNRTFHKLPRMPYSITTVMARGIADGAGVEGYKVVMLGKSRRNTVELHLHDSAIGSWTPIAVVLPEDLKVLNEEMVFYDGKFFCLTVEPWEENRRIMVFDVHRRIMVLPMPKGCDKFSRLLTCGDSLLLTGARVEEDVVKDVIIWQYCCPTWQEVAGMGTSLWEEFETTRWSFHCSSVRSWYDCVVVGENVCFRGYRSLEVLVYSMTRGSWTWLPTCPFTFGDLMKSLPFQPKSCWSLSQPN